MSTAYMVVLALNGPLFLAWAFVLFRTLFAQRRRALARTGKSFPGPIDAWHEWRHWWQAPNLKNARRLLIGLTFAVMSCTILMALMRASG